MAQKAETKFRQKARKLLEEIPGSWWESVQQMAIRGTPDIIGCVAGRFIGIELKASIKNKPEPLQQHKLGEIRAAGGVGLTLYPENLDAVLRELHAYAEKKQ